MRSRQILHPGPQEAPSVNMGRNVQSNPRSVYPEATGVNPWYGVHSLLVVALLTGCSLLMSADARRGDQHVEEGNWEEAVLAYQQAIKLDPFDLPLQSKLALARERAAAMHEERGRALLKEHQLDQALEAFKRALSLEPSRAEHHAAFAEALRLKEARDHVREAEQLHNLGRLDEAIDAYTRATELDPSLSRALEGIAALTEQQQASKREGGFAQPITLRFQKAGIKEVLEGLAKAAGFNVVFDKDVRNDPISVAFQETPFDQAWNLILSSNSLFSRRVGPDTVLVSPNTKQKQEQYQDLMIRTFYLSNVKAKDMLTLLRSMLDSKRMYANEDINAVVIRDQPEKLQLAERIILANDRQSSEVLFEVEVLEVDLTKNMTYGVNVPKQAGLGLIPPGFTGVLAADPQQFTYRQLTSLGPDSYLFRLPTTVLLDFFKQVNDTKTLASPKVRVVNNKKAEINIGNKQPILLSTTNVLPGQAATGAVPTTSTVTSIEFRDTGVKLTVEPSIHLGSELSLKMKIDIVSLGPQITLQASPLIQQFTFGNRSAETALNIKDGETIVLGGLIQETDQKTRQTVPFLGDLPLIGWLFSTFTTQKQTTEIILTITPHIVQTMTPPSPGMQTFWSGTESLYATSPLFSSTSQKSVGTGGNGPQSKLQPPPGAREGLAGSLGVPSSSRAGAGHGTVLTFKPSELATGIGQEFQIGLVAQSLEGLTEGVVTVEYDPQVLEFRRVVEGELLKRRGGRSSVTASLNPGTGSVQLTMRRQGEPASGNGGLVMLTFAGKAPGVSPLAIQMPEGLDHGKYGQPSIEGPGIVRVR